MPSKIDKGIVDQAIDEVGISSIRDKSCMQLSGGQLQLVFIARALASEPKVLVLDEPESHLDFRNQFMIINLIRKLVRERGLSCIINTHYPEHALRLSDTTLLLGQNSYLFGRTKEIITEKRVAEYFGINAKILPVSYKGEEIKAFVVLIVPNPLVTQLWGRFEQIDHHGRDYGRCELRVIASRGSSRDC